MHEERTMNPIIKRVSVGLNEKYFEIFKKLAEENIRTLSNQISWMAMAGSKIEEESISDMVRMDRLGNMRWRLDYKKMCLIPYTRNPPKQKQVCKIIIFKKAK